MICPKSNDILILRFFLPETAGMGMPYACQMNLFDKIRERWLTLKMLLGELERKIIPQVSSSLKDAV